MRRILVLWDIDHTLIDAGTTARTAYDAAFFRATGRRLEHAWRFDGRTELAAATEVLDVHGIPAGGGMLDTFLELIVEELTERAGELAAGGRVLDGAEEALVAAGELAGVSQTVLTGNLYPLAVLKLDAFGLSKYVDFGLGAYGGDAFERHDLPAHAFRRAAERGLGFTGADTVIVGDTVRDVTTAKRAGARAVAVATGTGPAAELLAAGADTVLPDLADTAAVIAALAGNAAAGSLVT
ncbi:haloacid dehalogenase-like hydrolase [Actinocorallia lasiicapitis]